VPGVAARNPAAGLTIARNDAMSRFSELDIQRHGKGRVMNMHSSQTVADTTWLKTQPALRTYLLRIGATAKNFHRYVIEEEDASA
jgi:hypothetical protein